MITEEEKMLKERIRYLLAKKKTSINKIADTESERIMLGRQINGEETVVSYRTIRKMLYLFHDISADWLVMGEGAMIKAEHSAQRIYTQHNEVHGNSAGGDINVGPDTIVTSKTVDNLQNKIAEQAARIAELEHDKELLQGIVATFTSGLKK